jgi:riboflavin synthase
VFTGIVEELGAVVDLDWPALDAARLRIRGPLVTSDARPGDSIAVNGVCLTVVETADGVFSADVMAETLRRSALQRLQVGDPVNLERAVTPTTRLGGHIVQGHVDGVGQVLQRIPGSQWEVVRFRMPESLRRYLVGKGSIAVDGVSLTVMDLGDDDEGHWFSVSLIPTTMRDTTLGSRGVGDPVNLEVDVTAKYVESLLAWRTT